MSKHRFEKGKRGAACLYSTKYSPESLDRADPPNAQDKNPVATREERLAAYGMNGGAEMSTGLFAVLFSARLLSA